MLAQMEKSEKEEKPEVEPKTESDLQIPEISLNQEARIEEVEIVSF